MRPRPTKRWRPAFEPMEGRRLCNADASVVAGAAGPDHPAKAVAASTASASAVQKQPTTGYLLYRITNPSPYNTKLIPPFGHVLTQLKQPVPGEVYNVLYVTVRNGTAKTFDATSNFYVRFPGVDATFPILNGADRWKPGQNYIFYVLTKKYYPLPSQVHSGFEFSLQGARSVAIPGPSGIFLRLKYNPATIDQALDHIVQFGEGAQGGKGIKYGLPDTALNEFVSAKTRRKDFGGYF